MIWVRLSNLGLALFNILYLTTLGLMSTLLASVQINFHCLGNIGLNLLRPFLCLLTKYAFPPQSSMHLGVRTED